MKLDMKTNARIVGIGGTARQDSTTEKALRAALDAAQRLGAQTELFSADELDLPMYGSAALTPRANALIDAIRRSDGILIASPSYHGSISGQVKNALDYVEELSRDERPYFEGRAVGCIVCAYGAQSIGTAIIAMRSVVHALRGWPTPLAAGISAVGLSFGADGRCTEPSVQQQLEAVVGQVWGFNQMRSHMARSVHAT